ncbi:cytochrome P450 [Candidatus Nitrosocosmicus franklandus]|uniref:Cytochrome P450 n=1 Tax=Candidatus Nitrosocosmicus franklandianus TaxID=1798806 RepID=A0A484IFG5_9ARCH|nr:cytochrome P450 [Candidatus Nitrosocosmicus franklandus]VFJ14899.1 Putative cytochrome P450 [Candidatus Nitrosocosmicus franklandus]
MENVEKGLPPGPSKRPVRLLSQFLRDPLQTFTNISKEYGDISYFKLGRQDVYMLNNPDYIERVLIYDHKNFKKGKRLEIAKRFLGEGLVTSEGEKHDSQKKIIHPFFLPKKISSFGPIMTKYALDMCNNWQDGSVIDIHKEMSKVTLSIICKSMMDYDMQSDESEEFGRAFTISKNYSKRLQHPLGHILDSIPILPKVVESRKAAKTLDSIVYKLMSTRRQEISSQQDELSSPSSSDKPKNTRDDLLTGLLLLGNLDRENNKTNKPNNSKGGDDAGDNQVMSDQQIRDHVITMLIAGHETTANALTWTYYLLAQHPEVEQKVFDEIDSVLKNNSSSRVKTGNGAIKFGEYRLPTTKDISQFKYIEKVFRESMRLFPPVWTIGRMVEEDYQVDKYVVPKGSAIFMSQYTMHRSPRYYENPEQFIPERWTDDFKRHLPRFSYFPFGGGLRGCIGEPFAWQEGILLIASISSYWKMTLRPNQKIKMDPGITLNPKKGIKMQLHARNPIPGNRL